MLKCWSLLKSVPGGVDKVVYTCQYRQWTVSIKPSLHYFQFRRFGLILGINIFSIFHKCRNFWQEMGSFLWTNTKHQNEICALEIQRITKRTISITKVIREIFLTTRGLPQFRLLFLKAKLLCWILQDKCFSKTHYP
jgi:hypothetical protein